MSEKSLPEIGKPYSTPNGFTMWRPCFTTLSVNHSVEGVTELVFRQPNCPEVSFAMDIEQRDQLVELLRTTPAQAATENVAQGVANV